jgi:hypothetical protein
MTNDIKTQLQTDFQNAKVQGSTRVARIRDILRSAASQTIDEVKQGSGEIREIATGRFSTVIDTLDDTLDDRTTNPSSETHSTDQRPLKPLLARLFAAVKTRLVTQFKYQTVKLDDDLGERYGDRYQAGKQRLDQVAGQMAERYHQAISEAKAQGSTPFAQTQAGIQDQAGAFGTAAARTEQQIKQRLKSLWQTTTTKL